MPIMVYRPHLGVRMYATHEVEVGFKTSLHMQAGKVMYIILQILSSFQLVPDLSMISDGDHTLDFNIDILGRIKRCQ